MRHSPGRHTRSHDMLLLAIFAAAMGLVLTSTSSSADTLGCARVKTELLDVRR